MRFALVTLFLAVGAVGTGVAWESKIPETKIEPFLLNQMHQVAGSQFPILVMMKGSADLSPAQKLGTKQEKGAFVYKQLVETATQTQKDIRQFLSDRGMRYKAFYVSNMIAVFDADADLVRTIAKRDDVEKVLNNSPKMIIPPHEKPLTKFDDSEPTLAPNIESTGASRVWSEFKVTGQGVVVAGQDTGVDVTHPALRSHYRGANGSNDYNWHDAISSPITDGRNVCGYNLSAPCDDDEHGSHTMGTMVGADDKGTTVGMAPGAQWIACRNMDSGTGMPSTYIDCFQFLLAPFPIGGDPFTQGKPELSADVINNSWGCPPEEGCHADEMLQVLRAMRAAGVMVVVSAGNDGPSCGSIQDAPAFHTAEAFSVGAIDHRNGKIADFSSRGPSTFDHGLGPDVVAPGVGVLSSVPGGDYESSFWDGTSMAGPHVAGLVALLWSAKPALVGHIEETEAIIRATAKKVTAERICGDEKKNAIPNNTYGYGIIDAYAAVKSVLNP